MKKPIWLAVLLASIFSFPVTTIASDTTSHPAKAVKRVNPKYPINEARKGREGWVRMSFMVTENGKVKDVVVEDSSGIKGFEKQAVRAVKKWRYEPATLDGLPVPSGQNKVILSFAIIRNDSNNRVVTRKFKQRYSTIAGLLEQNQPDKAKEQLDELLDNSSWTLTEDAYFGFLEAMVFGNKNKERFIRGLERAILSEDYLLPEHYLISLKELFAVRANSGEYAQALSLAERLKPLLREQPDEQGFLDVVEKFERQVEQSQQLKTQATISSRENWHQQLVGDQISLDVVDGKIESTQARCDNHFAELDMSKGDSIEIPAEWGSCALLVKGTEGTQIELLQQKNRPSAN